MNSRDIRVLFLYERKSKRNAVAAARNINSAFENGCVNEHTIWCWYGKFGTGDDSPTNNDSGRPETAVDNVVLRAVFVKKIQTIPLSLWRRTRYIFYNYFTSSTIDWQS